MCSAPKPKTPDPVNPYEGMMADEMFAQAARQIGIDEPDGAGQVRDVNNQMVKNQIAVAERDANFGVARQQLFDEGLLKETDFQGQDYLSAIQGRMYDNTQDEFYAEQKASTDKAAQDFKDMMSAQSEEQAKMMEEMMNAPTYQARQGDVAPVMAPVVTPKPIPVAPPTPAMEIQKTPPAPELTQTPNNMAIVRQPKSARARQRSRSRGTASLST